MGKIITIFLLILAGIGIYSWLSGGALAEIKRTAALEPNPLSSFFKSQLGKPVETDPEKLAPDVPTVPGTRLTGSSSSQSAEKAKDFGDPSPLRGTVKFQPVQTYYSNTTTSAASEYVVLYAIDSNKNPVTISGWSIQSAVSGNRAYIETGVPIFRLGSIESGSAISLSPGGSATIISGTSPLGISFRLNKCSGYLAQFQTFVPSISSSCPSPSSELPNTADNLHDYGASCIDFVRTLPSCTYHLATFPENISPNCRTFVTEALTYNSCVDRHQFDAGFKSGSWRIYVGSPNELWDNSHDVLRLLDTSGKTVDVWSY